MDRWTIGEREVCENERRFVEELAVRGLFVPGCNDLEAVSQSISQLVSPPVGTFNSGGSNWVPSEGSGRCEPVL